jgi:hypothetical protein
MLMDQQELRPAHPWSAGNEEIDMKYSQSRWAIFIAAVGVVVTLMAGYPAAAQAQTSGLRVNIPFEFHVGDQVLPAGSYMVMLRSGTALTISDGKGQAAVRLTNAVSRAGSRKTGDSLLVFMVYGDRYFLNEVRWDGYQDARSLVKSKTEIEFAKLNSTSTKAVVAAK